MVGSYPAEGDAFLKSLTRLSSLRLRNDTLAAKLPPMHCLSELRCLQVRAGVPRHCTNSCSLHMFEYTLNFKV